MERAEKAGLGIAIAGHVALFGALSLGWLMHENPPPPLPPSIDISLVDDVGLEAQAPQSIVPPAQSRAPDLGAPEDAPPPSPQAAEPDPTPPSPQPKAAPPPKPAPDAPPQPKKPVAPDKPDRAKTPPKRDAAPTTKTASTNTKSTGTDRKATTKRPRGSRLGDDFLKGITDQPSKTDSVTPQAAKIDARALASIVQAIARQIQPCADRQVNPGPGANQITIKLNLRLNRDGTLAATPSQVGPPGGLNGENDRYAQRVRDLGLAAFKGCSPLKLPAEYYSTPNGGWNNINYTWQLR